MPGKARRERITITLPPDVLKRVEAAAEKEGLQVSPTVAKILKAHFEEKEIGEEMVDYDLLIAKLVEDDRFDTKLEGIVRRVFAENFEKILAAIKPPE